MAMWTRTVCSGDEVGLDVRSSEEREPKWRFDFLGRVQLFYTYFFSVEGCVCVELVEHFGEPLVLSRVMEWVRV